MVFRNYTKNLILLAGLSVFSSHAGVAGMGMLKKVAFTGAAYFGYERYRSFKKMPACLTASDLVQEAAAETRRTLKFIATRYARGLAVDYSSLAVDLCGLGDLVHTHLQTKQFKKLSYNLIANVSDSENIFIQREAIRTGLSLAVAVDSAQKIVAEIDAAASDLFACDARLESHNDEIWQWIRLVFNGALTDSLACLLDENIAAPLKEYCNEIANSQNNTVQLQGDLDSEEPWHYAKQYMIAVRESVMENIYAHVLYWHVRTLTNTVILPAVSAKMVEHIMSSEPAADAQSS